MFERIKEAVVRALAKSMMADPRFLADPRLLALLAALLAQAAVAGAALWILDGL